MRLKLLYKVEYHRWREPAVHTAVQPEKAEGRCTALEQDSFLTARMRRGDEKGAEIFVRKYYDDILRYCGWHLPDRYDAEDAAQETFEKFFQSLRQYRHYGKAKNYLYVIAGNICKNMCRKNRELLLETLPETASAEQDPFAGREESLDMSRALSRLPQEFRSVLILYYFQDLKLREIAEILEISLSLAKYRLARGKEKFRQLLEQEERLWNYGRKN